MERDFIAWVKQRTAKLPQVAIGIGDDAALLAPSLHGSVVTTDSLCDGTHFILDECGPRSVGRKLAGVNLSDLAAMAADPVAIFLSLCLPRKNSAALASEIVEGVCEHAERFSVALAGGDTNVWDGPLVVHMTAIGNANPLRSWTRSGAMVGDVLVVSGQLGGSLLGKHLDFVPRIELAQWMRNHFQIHAATDISDGLGIDLLNICSQSRCGALLEMGQIPISQAAIECARTSGQSALDHALGDGEDFELLLSMPKSEAERLPKEYQGVALTRIGEIVSRTGLWTKEAAKWRQVAPKGYVHR